MTGETRDILASLRGENRKKIQFEQKQTLYSQTYGQLEWRL